MTLIGSLIIGIAHFAVAFSPPVFILILLYGILFGLASGFAVNFT